MPKVIEPPEDEGSELLECEGEEIPHDIGPLEELADENAEEDCSSAETLRGQIL